MNCPHCGSREVVYGTFACGSELHYEIFTAHNTCRLLKLESDGVIVTSSPAGYTSSTGLFNKNLGDLLDEIYKKTS